jgi:lipoyl(octanoyl) transferase
MPWGNGFMAFDGGNHVPILKIDASAAYEEVALLQEELVSQAKETLVFCEHAPTITLGTSAKNSDLAFAPDYYERLGVTLVKSPRGGKATYHGPGQPVCYPIINLRQRGMTIHEYLKLLESLMIEICSVYGIKAHRVDGKAGCWVEDRKIGFIGVRVRRGFSFHGFSLNIKPQREAFRMIVPCGMPNLHITSFEEEMDEKPLDLWDVAEAAERLFFESLV